MPFRNLGLPEGDAATQRSYVHAVAKFSRYFGRSPERLDLEDVRAFQVHLVANGISWPALNQDGLRAAVLLRRGHPTQHPALAWSFLLRNWTAPLRSREALYRP